MCCSRVKGSTYGKIRERSSCSMLVRALGAYEEAVQEEYRLK